MSHTASEVLQQLEDRFISGELMESDYKQLKWKILKGLRDRGEAIPDHGGRIERAELVDSRGEAFCYIPTDPFFFGPENDYAELLAPVYIAQRPVTAEQFRVFLEDSGHPYSAEDWEQLALVSPEPECPVSHISWDDAKAYCRWLRRVTGEYYSLPNETEWEKAARGIDGRYYPWGDGDLTTELACYETQGMSHSSTVPLGIHTANKSPYGCEEMVGNVWEFCLDSFDDDRDPHILRGGSWCNSWEYCNNLARTFIFPPDKRVDYGGFRITYLPQDMLADYQAAYAGGGPSQLSLNVVKFQQQENATAASAGTPMKSGGAGALSSRLGAALARAATEEGSAVASDLSTRIDEILSESSSSEDEIVGTKTIVEVHDAGKRRKKKKEAKGRSVEDAIAAVTGSSVPGAEPQAEPIQADADDEAVAAEDYDAEESTDPSTMSVQERMLWEISNSSQKYLQDKKDRGEVIEEKKPLQKYRPEGAERKGNSASDFVVGAIDEIRDDDDDDELDLGAAATAGGRDDDKGNSNVHNLLHAELAASYEPPGPNGATYAVFMVWCLLVIAVVASFVLRLTAG